jgi:hypothetical protein
LFWGMIGVTPIDLAFTTIFCVVIRKIPIRAHRPSVPAAIPASGRVDTVRGPPAAAPLR